MENNLALVGCYYFKSSEKLLSAINEQIKRGIELKGEYFLADAVNIMLERDAQIRTELVDVWLDTGTIDTTLETNRYLLDHGCSNPPKISGANVEILPPVFIHPTASICDSTIGPYVSVGAECEITGSRIENSIIEAGAQIKTAFLINTIMGQRTRVEGKGAESGFMTLNIGDLSSVVVVDK
jgi:glucose-1-phosphate thymidylyltransferase